MSSVVRIFFSLLRKCAIIKVLGNPDASVWKSGVRLTHRVLFPTAAGEGPPQHAAAPPAGDLQSAQLHGPFCRSGKAVQCGSSENHWKIRASEYLNQDVSRKSFQKDWGFAWSFLWTWPQSYMGARLHVRSWIPITCWERLRQWPTTPWAVSWGRSAFLSLRRTPLCLLDF